MSDYFIRPHPGPAQLGLLRRVCASRGMAIHRDVEESATVQPGLGPAVDGGLDAKDRRPISALYRSTHSGHTRESFRSPRPTPGSRRSPLLHAQRRDFKRMPARRWKIVGQGRMSGRTNHHAQFVLRRVSASHKTFSRRSASVAAASSRRIPAKTRYSRSYLNRLSRCGYYGVEAPRGATSSSRLLIGAPPRRTRRH